MFRNINVKRLLFEIIILLFSIGLFLWVCTPFSSQGEQFTFTVIGVMITVFIINYLLTQDKKQRYKILNKGVGEEVVTVSQVSLLQILDTFGCLKTPEERGIENIGDVNYTREKIKSCFKSDEYRNWLSSLTLDKKTLKKLNSLKGIFSKTYKNLRKSLYKIQPHPDPILIENIKENQAKIDGSVMAIGVIIEKFSNGLPEELKEKIENKQKGENLILEAMPILIKGMITGFNKDSRTLHEAIKENLEFLQLIAERADKNYLEFNLE